MRPSLLFLALALVACDRSSRSPSSSSTATGSSMYAGPQALVLRLPRSGGPPRVFAYPKVDSAVWVSTDPAPTPAAVLAFSDEHGSVAYRDTDGRAILLDLRLGTITVATNGDLTGLASADGRAIYGITKNGQVMRMTPAGEWTLKPPQDAQRVFPQADGALLVMVGRGANTHLLKYVPPDQRLVKEMQIPATDRITRSLLGDRLYLAADSGIVMLRTRTMDWGPPVSIQEPIELMAPTPSGDRIFVLTSARNQILVVDRFREAVTGRVDLPGRADELRVDPFGRYLLAHDAGGDSVWVVAIGTERLIGGVPGTWRTDLPFVGFDGAVAVASGNNVVFYDGETLRERGRVRGGARDFWYPFMWDGFRPRAASLDVPVQFDSTLFDSTAPDSLADSLAADTTVAAAVDTAESRGFIVSFAAFLVPERARELAARIIVNGQPARVVETPRNGTIIYRVILGPFASRDEAERAGRESHQAYWVYEGSP